MSNIDRTNSRLSETNPNPGNFPLGSMESRAAARARLAALASANPGPHIITFFYEAGERDASGCPIGEPVKCESVFAKMSDGDRPYIEYRRLDGESWEEFQVRVLDALPHDGKTRVVTFFPMDEPAGREEWTTRAPI
jgi:hypothetical protein